MFPIIYPYNIGSKSARALAAALGTRCVRENGTYKKQENHVIINWGNPRLPRWSRNGVGFINDLSVMGRSQNKLAAFESFQRNGVSIPKWTTDRKTATKWITDGDIVLCRTLLNSHSGRGITIATSARELVVAPLYVQYKKKKKEFRVHVFRQQVIDVQEKRLSNGAKEEEGYNQYIRSHRNGWIFARENITEPKELRSLAVLAVAALALDFGAVDIIYNDKEKKCYVLEVNSAPGLEGQTLISYVNAIRNFCVRTPKKTK